MKDILDSFKENQAALFRAEKAGALSSDVAMICANLNAIVAVMGGVIEKLGEINETLIHIGGIIHRK